MKNRIHRSECCANRDLAARGVRSAAEIRAATDKILRRRDAHAAARERVARLAVCAIALFLAVALFYSF